MQSSSREHEETILQDIAEEELRYWSLSGDGHFRE